MEKEMESNKEINSKTKQNINSVNKLNSLTPKYNSYNSNGSSSYQSDYESNHKTLSSSKK